MKDNKLNSFYTVVVERIRKKYVMIVGNKYLINQLEHSIYPPNTAKNNNLDLLVYFNSFEGFKTLLFFYLAKRSKGLTNWFTERGIKYNDNSFDFPILVELDDEEPDKSYVLMTNREELEMKLNFLKTNLENMVPSTALEMRTLDNGTIAFTKPGQMEEFILIWKKSNDKGR
jgi:hypothetical protein